MRVLFLTLYPFFVPSSRFRVHQFLGYLRRKGFECEVVSAISDAVYCKCYGSRQLLGKLYFQASEFLTRIFDILKTDRYDLIFLQKGILSVSLRGMEHFLFSRNKKVVFDFDDAVYLAPPQRFPNLFSFLEDKKQIIKIIQRSRAVIAGSPYLAQAVSDYNSHLCVIPTCVDTDWFMPATEKRDRSDTIIFWSGNRSGNYHLNDLAGAISHLAGKYRIKLVIQSDSLDFIDFPRFKPCPVEFRKWSIETELANFQGADIGIMPMHDTEWERGKCAFKALLYMSVGLPVIASSVGAINDILKEGQTGFFADNEKDWVVKLSVLIEDVELRKNMGRQGRSLVEDSFSVKAYAPRLETLLRETAKG